jgi:hypothetical protein
MHVVCMGFVLFPSWTGIISLGSINQFVFPMVKCGVLYEVRTDYLNSSILTGFDIRDFIYWLAD